MNVAANDRSPAGTLHVLHPGDVACGERGERFETLLGSCVAIVLTDPRRTVGAMCHIVHAMPAPADRLDEASYADVALRPTQQPPESLVGRRLCAIAYGLYGAPGATRVSLARRPSLAGILAALLQRRLDPVQKRVVLFLRHFPVPSNVQQTHRPPARCPIPCPSCARGARRQTGS